MTRLGLVLGATALVVLGGAAAAYAFVVRAGPNPARGTIAFMGGSSANDLCQQNALDAGPIYVVAAQGGERRALLPHKRGLEPTWSPDGRSLALGLEVGCGAQARTSIGVVGARTHRIRFVTRGPHDRQPAWSPDGKTIAFLRRVGVNDRLYEIPAAGGQARPLGTVPAVTGLSWSPDGRSLVIARTRPARRMGAGVVSSGGPMGLYVVRADGTGLHSITRGTVLDRDPSWSPDGHWIAFVRWTLANNTGMLGGPDWMPNGVYLVHPNGSGLHHLAGAYLDPSWSPDSKYLVASGLDRSTKADPGIGVSLRILRAHGLLAGTRFREWTATHGGGRDWQATWKAQ